MPQRRKAVASGDTTPSYHAVSHCERRVFFEVVDSKNFSHRCDVIGQRLSELASRFCIDIATCAFMSYPQHWLVRI